MSHNKYRHQIEPIHCNYLANSNLINTKFHNISKFRESQSSPSSSSSPSSLPSSSLNNTHNSSLNQPRSNSFQKSASSSPSIFSYFFFSNSKTHNKLLLSTKYQHHHNHHNHNSPMLKRCLIRELTLTRRERNLWIFVVINSLFLIYLVYYNPETSKAIIGQLFRKDDRTSSKLRKLKDVDGNHDRNSDKMMQLLNHLNSDSSTCGEVDNSYASLLEEIKHTPYKNHSDFLTHDKFRNTWSCLNEEQKLNVKIKLFDYPWNKPRIMERSDGTKRVAVRRFPNVICIGSKKCGTGALQFFMKLHPYFRKPPHHDEPHFFDNQFEKGLEFYLDMMPFATSSQVVFEKTPKYITLDGVAQRIKKSLPDSDDLKIIVVVCDPIKRAFSDFTHVKNSNPPVWDDVLKIKYNNSFGNFVESSVKYMQEVFNDPKKRPEPTKNFQHFIHGLYKSETPELTILSNGMYKKF